MWNQDEIKKMQAINAQKQAAADTNTLGSTLSTIASQTKDNGNFFTNLIGGIKDKASDIGNTLNNFGKTIVGGATQESNAQKIKDINSDASAKRNEIAKKYGYADYSAAMNDENASQDFWNEIKSANSDTKTALSDAAEQRNKSYGNTKDINLQEAQGQGLSTIGTVASLIPGSGAAAVAGNIAGAAFEGVGDAYKNAAQNGTNVDANEAFARGLAGAASAGVGGAVAGKLASKGANTITNAALRGAASGAASGATAGAIMSGATGGNALTGALEGATSGAAGGAVMSGANAAANKAIATGLNKINGKLNPAAPQIQTTNAAETTTTAETPSSTATSQQNTAVEATQRNNLTAKQEMKISKKLSDAKQRQGEALLDQYGTLDKPVRRAVKNPEGVLTKLQDDMGISSPEQLQYAHSRLTSGDGIVSQITNEIAGTAENVDITFDRNSIKKMIAGANLGDIDATDGSSKKGKTVMTTIQNALKSIPDAGNDGTTANGKDVLDAVRKLNAAAADLEGTDGRRYHNPTSEDLAQAKVLKNVASQLEARVNDSTADDISNIVTPDRIQAMREVMPDNKQYQQWVDNNIANNKSAKSWRSSVATLVNGGKIADASNMSRGGFADRANTAMKAMTSANPVVAIGQSLATKVLQSDKVSQMRANRAQKQAANYQAQLDGTRPASNNILGNIGSRLADASSAINANIAPINELGEISGSTPYNLGNRLANRLSNEAVVNTIAQNAAAEQSNNDAQTRATEAMQAYANTYGSDTLQNVLANIGDNSQNTLANALTGVAAVDSSNTAYGQQMANLASATTSTSNSAAAQLESQMQMLQNGMQNAMAAGDFTSYAKIMDLYNDAYKMYSTIKSAEAKNTTSSASKLSDTQKKALAARSQLAQLSSLNPTGRSMLPDWLRNLTGGDEYTSTASQLASTIGYMQSGANVSESEKAAIRTNYIPQATDSAEVRARKLQAAQQLLNDYLAGTEYAQQ